MKKADINGEKGRFTPKIVTGTGVKREKNGNDGEIKGDFVNFSEKLVIFGKFYQN